MNKRLLNSRFYQILAVMIVLVLILCVRLFVLTVIQKDEWTTAAENQNTKEITTLAPRGKILDRYGREIATNKQMFTLTFNVSGLSTEEINKTAYSLIQILEENDDEYVDNFPIKISGDNYRYTFDDEKREWLEDRGYPDDFTAEQAFNALRSQYEIDPQLDRYEAADILQGTYGVYPPINVRSMTYTYDTKKEQFLEKYGLDTDLSAYEAFVQLRKTFKIDPELSDSEARKIFRIREEIQTLGYNRYLSATVAEDISEDTLIYVEERSSELRGVEIASDTVRYYPNGSTLAHVVGYMGSISDYQYEEYVTEKGYNADDLIGKDGIEASMESYLKGTDGVTRVRVDSSGNYIDTISETEPVAGQNVYLTVDLDLQKVAEDALKQGIESTASGTSFKSKYGNVGMSRFSNCASGAVVAIEVETGDVLAMASYPDFDPNIFAEGISTEDWESVQSTNPRDYLAPTPLYNSATKASVQPGSTFKPVTAVAALQCGLDPNMSIRDRGHIDIGGRSFGCSAWNSYRGTHGSLTLRTGIQNSCNYYFYCIATNTDWGTGASLGFSEDISIEKIMEVAQEFGLGQETGIELDEVTTPLASAERKMEATKNSLWSYLYSNAIRYWPESVVEDEEALRKDLDTITDWIEENPGRGEIIERIKAQTQVSEDSVETVADICKYSYFNQAQWTVGDEFNISIGQGDNAYTPLQMARYAATLGNYGVRNQVSIVKGIEGEGETVKEEPYTIDVEKEDMDEVLAGMRLVASRGTLAATFGRFPIEVAGKTGTAERSGYINPVDEVGYVKEHLSSIAPGVSWNEVEELIGDLMLEDPESYPTENDAVDDAVIKASGNKITQSDIDQFKDTYDEFAWVVTLAPADDPKIAVVVMLVQGGISSNAAPVAREIIGEYLQVDSDYEEADFETKMQ
ncbi:MAG: penicillin-binding transpeptidase domain-containing protein [Anaerovoracaceae bacterium]|mgnify:CR=1 FL=1|nr:penicillin-binding transpeptidase domain-containing protein [Anaerovoracaceae bacterium]